MVSAGIGVGFGVVLADFEDHPRGELVLALADQLGRPQQQTGALFRRSAAPGLKRLQRRLHRRLDLGCSGFLEQAHELRRDSRD